MGGPGAGHAALNINAVKPPGEAYMLLADKGADTTKYSSAIVFAQSFYAGCYIGFGALLATTISEAMPGATGENPGFKSFIFAGLFPVNLLLILLSGGILFTGTSAAAPAAIYEGKAKVIDVARCLALSWLGNVLGSALFAYFTKWCKLLEAGSSTANGAIAITKKKISKDFGTTFFKGIGCNWMVCMAVFLCGQAQDMCGKYLGIWFPISCFVMCGFEHIPANFYICAEPQQRCSSGRFVLFAYKEGAFILFRIPREDQFHVSTIPRREEPAACCGHGGGSSRRYVPFDDTACIYFRTHRVDEFHVSTISCGTKSTACCGTA